jgi:hypothetical protein
MTKHSMIMLILIEKICTFKSLSTSKATTENQTTNHPSQPIVFIPQPVATRPKGKTHKF